VLANPACSLQVFLLLAIILAFFLLTTSISPHVQLGLYNKYLKQHRAVFGLSLLTLMLVGSTGAYRLVSSNHSSMQVHWQSCKLWHSAEPALKSL
jgi:hypothetical protein